ncbi:MAG: acyl-CoA thioesterase [Candidatus Eremiobacteraeota bacterium]|nr:acyl-CoA thioesterase [Candidatus Eremiobacteraeota bacterium]MBC5826290.1 acyl-CoA thioesterase [Candidatus Eremiobacteraeota bacterium]
MRNEAAPTLPGKPVSASASVLATLMEPAAANPMGNIHGGHIMKLTDQAAAAAAIRHARKICVTASIDRLDFVNPVHVGDMVVLKSAVNYTHRTSMEVGVRIEAERLETGERMHVATAYLIFVALDSQGRPSPVPPILPETESERVRYRQADLRYRSRQAQRLQERALGRSSEERR